MLGFCMIVRKNASPEAMNAAMNAVVRDNDCMRLRIVKKGRKYSQYFNDYEPFTLELENVADEAELEAKIEAYRDEYVLITDARLWKAKLVASPDAVALVVRLHHACSDGYSQEMLFSQLDAHYSAIISGTEPAGKKPGSYLAAIESDQKYFHSDDYAEDREWWRKAYKKQRYSRYCIPTGSRAMGDHTASEHMNLSPALCEALTAFCKENACSLQSALMTLTAITTWRLTGKREFQFFCLSHGRSTLRLRRVMGCITATVPVMFKIDESATIADTVVNGYSDYLEYLKRCRFPNSEHVPLYLAKSILNGFNFANNWMVFSAMTYDRTSYLSQYEFRYLDNDYSTSQFYLGMTQLPDGGMDIYLKYHKKLYTAEKVRRWGEVLTDTVQLLAHDGGRTVGSIQGA